MSTSSASIPVWSATPTPFHENLTPDAASVERLVEHHILLGVQGIMLGGTCGEGPWMPMDDLVEVVRVAAAASVGRIRIAAQVTDNSVRRMLGHIERLQAVGAEYAVVASPYYLMNATPKNVFDLYLEVIRSSALPVGFYDRGQQAAYPVENEFLPELLAEPNVLLVKYSSQDKDRLAIYLESAKRRTGLPVLTGGEFNCDEILRAGCHGLFLGGGIFNARLARAVGDAVQAGNGDAAQKIQARMNELMYRVYGGPQITCWLTGLKYLLVQLGVFSHTTGYLRHPLTPECKAAIDEIVTGRDADHYRESLVAPEPAPRIHPHV